MAGLLTQDPQLQIGILRALQAIPGMLGFAKPPESAAAGVQAGAQNAQALAGLMPGAGPQAPPPGSPDAVPMLLRLLQLQGQPR